MNFLVNLPLSYGDNIRNHGRVCHRKGPPPSQPSTGLGVLNNLGVTGLIGNLWINGNQHLRLMFLSIDHKIGRIIKETSYVEKVIRVLKEHI